MYLQLQWKSRNEHLYFTAVKGQRVYFAIVKEVVEQGIKDYIAAHGIGRDEVLTKIWTCIDHTSQQHNQPDPNIDYGSPLCRLGYLYRHVGLQATLFERVLSNDQMLQSTISNPFDYEELTICSLGGGPGTELLGLIKWLSRDNVLIPNRINFTVMDNVNHWAETWTQLARASEQTIQATKGQSHLVIAPTFLAADVLAPSSYSGYPSMFKDTKVVVFNYLLSENQSRLDVAQPAIAALVDAVGDGCNFVVIDRLEQNTKFVQEVVELFESLFGQVKIEHLGGVMDSDEQASELGDELRSRLRSPRLRFWTRISRTPTAFWFTVQK